MPEQDRYRRTLRFISLFRAGIATTLAFSIAASLVAALLPWPVKLLIDGVLTERRLSLGPLGSVPAETAGEQVLAAMALAAAYLALAVLSASAHGGAIYYATKIGQDMVLDLRMRLARSLRAPSDRWGSPGVGDTIWRGVNDAGSAAMFTHFLFRSSAQTVFTIGAMAVFMFAIDPLLATMTLFTLPLLVVVIRVLAGPIQRAVIASRQQHARLTSFFEQTTRALDVIRVFGRDEDEERRATAASKAAADAALRQSARDRWLVGATASINGLGMAIVILLGTQRVLSGAMTVGSLWVFISYMQAMYRMLDATVLSYTPLQDSITGLTRVLDIVERTERADEPAGHETPVTERRIRLRERITVHALSFCYPGASKPSVSDLDLEIRAGEVVALVGHTGAGKTTLIRLLAGLIAPTSGTIAFDGVNIGSMNPGEAWTAVSIVPQPPLLLAGTVRENVAYGRPSARDEDLETVLHAVAAAFIHRLPNGLDTDIGDSGTRLSGGEQQRLALGRALLKEADLLLLDEPTSAIDIDTENEIIDRLAPVLVSRTVVFATHRLSLLRLADRIFVMDEGQIIETGTHDDLIAMEGRYYNLFRRELGLPQNSIATGSEQASAEPGR